MHAKAQQFPDRLQAILHVIEMLAMNRHVESSSGGGEAADVRLVAAAMAGDRHAFDRLVETYQSTIAQQMQRFSRDTAVIEDLVHDVFVEAYFSLKSYRARAPFIHWLRKIAVRVGYQSWKKCSRTVSLFEVPETGQLVSRLDEAAGSAADASETLGNLLELLPPRDRLILTLMYWDGCTVAEAAELSGWTQTMTKVQAFRARRKLKKLIEESGR